MEERGGVRKEERKIVITLCILWLCTSSPHIVHVVSILDVPTMLGSVSFQSNDVNGAQNSELRF